MSDSLSEEERRQKRRVRYGRYASWALIAAFIVFIAIVLGPYARSTLVRDAAVTSWINIATSPIYGEVDLNLPKPGDPIGADGLIATVVNPKADRSRLDRALAAVDEAESLVEAAQGYLEELDARQAERRERYERRRARYETMLQVSLEGVASRLVQARERLTVMARLAERKRTLADRGSVSITEVDEAQADLLESQQLVTDLEARQADLQTLIEAARAGDVLMQNGDNPLWETSSLQELDGAIADARFQLLKAQAGLTNAWANAQAEEETYQKLQRGEVLAPPDTLLWSTIVGEGAVVDIGTPVASWIDCKVLLVDVPLADAEVALLEVDDPAHVLLEGESRERQAKVYLTRGSAATIGADDLAALSKGRGPAVAQVLLSLETSEDDRNCASIGRAAFVDFPAIGFFDVLFARLRL